MTDRWIINSGATVGRSHIRENIPCQDSVLSRSENGVQVIALSDGCGSAPFSEYGSELTVNALCDLFVSSFDSLYELDDLGIKKAVVSAIVDKVKEFLLADKQIIPTFRRDNPKHYEKYKSRWPGYAAAEKIYPLTLLDATLQFVAVKGNRLVYGRLGDGIIADVKDGALRLLSSEDKVGVASNATWYPTTILLAASNPKIDPWQQFEIGRVEDNSGYDMLLITSDGVAEVLVGEDDEENVRFLYADEIANLLTHPTELYGILEKQYKPMKGIYDDLSVIVMQKPDFKIESVVLRQYDVEGRTVANERTESLATIEINPVISQKSIEEPETETGEGDRFVSVFGEKMKARVEKYSDDPSYTDYFMEQAVKIHHHLEGKDSESLDRMLAILHPYVDADDWSVLLKQLSKLRLFTVDKRKKLIRRKEK
jgi:serine/threonine protein phosphatase PrpC